MARRMQSFIKNAYTGNLKNKSPKNIEVDEKKSKSYAPKKELYGPKKKPKITKINRTVVKKEVSESNYVECRNDNDGRKTTRKLYGHTAGERYASKSTKNLSKHARQSKNVIQDDTDYEPDIGESDDDEEFENSDTDFETESQTKTKCHAFKRKVSKLRSKHIPSEFITVKSESKSDNFDAKCQGDDDDDDWEEVQDMEVFDVNNYNPEMPKNLQITIQKPDTISKKKRDKWEWIRSCVRLRMNHWRKQIQLNAHRVHLLLYMYRLRYLNSIVNDDLVRALVISSNLFQQKFSIAQSKKFSSSTLVNIFKFFQENIQLSIKKTKEVVKDIQQEIIAVFKSGKLNSKFILNLIMAAFLRCLKYKIRLCYLLYPVPIKPLDLLTKNSKFTKNKSEPVIVLYPKIQDYDCYWLEIFDSNKKRWVSIDFVNEIYDEPTTITGQRKRQQKIVSYVFAIDNDGYINDVTQRYAWNWFSHERIKNRIEGEWLQETLNLVKRPFVSVEDDADKIEFEQMIENVELPKRISDYKNHPLFVLQRDILKFQALYPSDLPPLGFYNYQPIYSRDCVHTLKSRETWLRDARIVKLNEKPYKMVPSRFKKKKAFSGGEDEREQLELFGEWQTQPYEPLIAKNGIVPRNAYGNVDLYKECMLPVGTVLLKLPGIAQIASKMNIDCAAAVVGFENNKKGIGFHPILGGFVVCKEFEDALVNAWKEQKNAQLKRAKEEREKKIYDNWRKLIRNLIIRHNLKIKYG